MFTIPNREITTGGTMENNLESQLRDIMSQGLKVSIRILVRVFRKQGYIQEVGTDYIALKNKQNDETIAHIIPFNGIASIDLKK